MPVELDALPSDDARKRLGFDSRAHAVCDVLTAAYNSHPDRAHTSEVSRDLLAEHLAAERAVTREQARITLHHSVLPKLADFGVIDYDAALGIVTLRDVGQAAALADQSHR